MSNFVMRRLITLIVGSTLIKNKEYIDLKRLLYLLFGSIFISILALLFLSISEQIKARMENREAQGLLKLLDLTDTYSMDEILVGMSSNIIFGFMDNAALFFGLSALKPYLPGGEYIQTGLANTFADLLASFLGTVISTGIEGYTGITRRPIWAEIVGIGIGCLLGIYIPSWLTGKR